MKFVYLFFILLISVLAVLFAAQNGATVEVSFFSWSASGSLSLILILTISLGIVIGVLIMAPSAFKRVFQSSGLKRRLRRLEKEKSSLAEKVAAGESKGDAENVAPEQRNPADGSASQEEVKP